MKKLKLIFIVILSLFFLTCKKDTITDKKLITRCGDVSYKFFKSPAGDSSITFRTYWLQWTPDTTCPPGNPNCGRYYDIEVAKGIYDTMIIIRYPDRYCIIE